MTLRSRNILLLGLFITLTLGLIGFVVLLFNVAPGLDAASQLLASGRAYYLFLSWSLSESSPYLNIISPGVCLLIAWLASLVFLRNFRRISSPQLFFYLLFWISMGFELVRALNVYLLSQDLSLLDHIALTRVDTFGRLFGSLSLFAASLYATGVKVQYQGSILGGIFLVSVVLAYLVPFDSSKLGQTLLYMPSTGFSLDVFRLVAALLTLLNFAKQAIASRDGNELSTIVSVLLLLIGHELVYAGASWFGDAVAWLALAVGTLWLTRRSMSDYMWY